MEQKAISEKKFQASNFAKYKSLDFKNKIYQIKAFKFAKKLVKPGQKVLELGCADGSFLKYISDNTKVIPYGLDISSPSVKIAKEKGVNARTHDLSNKLPYKNSEFKLVISLEVIEHLYDTDFFMEEIRRVLDKNGYLIISTPNIASLNNRARLLFGKYPKYMDYNGIFGGHIHLYTPDVLQNQLKLHRFKLIESTSPNFFNPFITKAWFPNPLKNLSMFLGDIFPNLGSHIIVVAQKI